MRIIIALSGILALISTGGCAQKEIQKPASLDRYDRAYVSVMATDSNADNDIATLQNLIIGELNNRNLYHARAAAGATSTADGLVIRVDVLKLHRFNGGKGVDNSPDFFKKGGTDGIDIGQEFSKSKVIARVTLEDGKSRDVLSTFPLSGDSPRMNYKEVDWRWGSLLHALLDFARQLADVFPPPRSQ